MGIPNFLAYAQPVASPLQAAIQGGIGTYGSLQKLRLQREQEKRAEQTAAEQQQMAPLKMAFMQQQIAASKSAAETARLTQQMQGQLTTAKIKQMQTGLGNLTGPAAEADSYNRAMKAHPANTPEGQKTIEAWDAKVGMEKAKMMYWGSNYWLKNLTPLKKEQFYQGMQETNARLQQTGQTVLTDRQYAQQIGLIPSEQAMHQTAVGIHVKEIQGQQGANGQPIQHPATILSHIANGVPSQQIATGNAPPPGAPQQPAFQQGGTGVTPTGMPLQPGVAPTGMPPTQPVAAQPTQAIPEPQPGLDQLRAGAPQMGTTPQPAPQPMATPDTSAGPAAAMVRYPVPLTGAQKAQIAPVDYAARAKQMGLSILGRTSDTQNRSKVIYGNQSEITIGNMQKDVHAMYAYSGPEGKTKLLKDQAVMAATGKAAPEYMAYQRFLTNAKVLQGQIIQYYGQSVQPVQQEEIRTLTDPSNWINNPKTTHEKWDAFTKTLSQEIALRRHALQDPEAYFSEPKQKAVSYTDADYKSTAAKYGMTVPELKAYLKKAGGK